MIPELLDHAAVPAETVNWTSSEVVTIEDWCAYLGELTGLEPKLVPSDAAIPSAVADTTRLASLVSPARVPWQEGIRRMVEARNPELLRGAPGG
jgi:hypothetical protein